MGFDGLEAWMRDMRNKPDKVKAMEKFLAKHPELNAMTQARCPGGTEVRRLESPSRVTTRMNSCCLHWKCARGSMCEQRVKDAPEVFASIEDATAR